MINVNIEEFNKMVDERLEAKLKEYGLLNDTVMDTGNVIELEPLVSRTKNETSRWVKVEKISWKNDKKTVLVWSLELLDNTEKGKVLNKYFHLKTQTSIQYLITELKKLNVHVKDLQEAQSFDYNGLIGKTIEVNVIKKDGQDTIYFVKIGE